MLPEGRPAAIAWSATLAGAICGVIGTIYGAKGGLAYPVLEEAGWFVGLAILFGAVLLISSAIAVVRALAVGMGAGSRPGGATAARIACGTGIALAVALAVVAFQIPASGIGPSTVICPPGTTCLATYGSSRLFFTVAAIAYGACTLLFGAAVLALARLNAAEEEREVAPSRSS